MATSAHSNSTTFIATALLAAPDALAALSALTTLSRG